MEIIMVFQLFLTFLKIGAFTFGGGYAMIPLIEREVCTNKKWLESKDILEVVAIAETTPGPIAINAATFVGYKKAGFLGALAATLGVVLPSFLIISALSFILVRFREYKPVVYAFMGIRAAVLALILKALFTMYKAAKKDIFAYVIMGVALCLVAVLKIDAFFVILGCALAGLIYTVIATRKAGRV
jgi:chromate transporter